MVSRNADFYAEGCLVAHSLDGALEIARRNGEDELFVIGGGEIFHQALPLADRIYLTQVNATTEADVFFPILNQDEWHVQESLRVPAGPKDDFDHTYQVLVRVGIN